MTDEEPVTLTLTRAEFGLVAASVRNLRRKARKAARGLETKFGDEAVIPTERNAAIESLHNKIEAMR